MQWTFVFVVLHDVCPKARFLGYSDQAPDRLLRQTVVIGKRNMKTNDRRTLRRLVQARCRKNDPKRRTKNLVAPLQSSVKRSRRYGVLDKSQSNLAFRSGTIARRTRPA